jgi:hypothetical protein
LIDIFLLRFLDVLDSPRGQDDLSEFAANFLTTGAGLDVRKATAGLAPDA